MRICWVVLFKLLLSACADATEITLDLSSSRDINMIVHSGVKIKLLGDERLKGVQDYRFENEDIHWIFPQGIEMRQKAVSSIFTVRNGTIRSGSGISERIMPLEDAYAAMADYIGKLKPEKRRPLDLKRLDDWYAVQKQKAPGENIEHFGIGIGSKRTGFRIGVHIRHSFNLKYPVTLDMDFGWFDEDARPEAPEIELNTGIIDLLPLGGKIYDRSESANPNGEKMDPRFEAWMKGDKSKWAEVEPLLGPVPPAANSPSTQPVSSPEPKPNRLFHLIWIAAALLLWWLYRRYLKIR